MVKVRRKGKNEQGVYTIDGKRNVKELILSSKDFPMRFLITSCLLFSLLALHGCGYFEEEETNSQHIEYFNAIDKPATLSFYQDTTYTVGNGIKVDSITIGYTYSKHRMNRGYRLDQTMPTSFFKGTRVEVHYFDGRKAYFNKPDSRYPVSMDAASLLSINPINQPFVPVSIQGRQSNYHYVLAEGVYTRAE